MLVVTTASCVSTEGLAGDDSSAQPAVADVTQAPTAPAAKPSPCPTTTARFCLDFENKTIGDWFSTQDDVSPEATPQEDDTAPSPPFVLATVAAAGKASWSSIFRIVTVPADTLRIEVDMNLAPPSAPHSAGFNPIVVADAANKVQFIGYWAMPFGDVITASDGTDANTKSITVDPAAPRGKWTHASIEIGFATHGHVKMTIDGRVVVDQKDVPTAAQDAAPADGVRVYFGAQTSADSTPNALTRATAKYDNLQVY
jgi:hypothetical protein